MTIKTHPAVAEYLARIQAALADLPASEVEEILEDIGPHLAEVAGELGEDVSVDTMTERLGTPEQYASELRAAAGYPPAGPVPPGRRPPGQGAARFALWSLVLSSVLALIAGLGYPNLVGDVIGVWLLFNLPLYCALIMIFGGHVTPTAVAALPEYRSAAATGRGAVAALPGDAGTYLRSLRPAWWLVRVVALVAALLFALNHGRAPQLISAVIALIVLLWVGGRARRDHRWNWFVLPANFFAAGLLVALVGVAWNGLADTEYPAPMGYQPGLLHDGRYVDNVYVFGPDGRPVPEAYLYDQDGRAITVLPRTCDGDYEPTNKVPQPRLDYDPQGRCIEIIGVPFTVAIPNPQPAPTTSTPPTTPGQTTTPPPTTPSTTPASVPPPPSK